MRLLTSHVLTELRQAAVAGDDVVGVEPWHAGWRRLTRGGVPASQGGAPSPLALCVGSMMYDKQCCEKSAGRDDVEVVGLQCGTIRNMSAGPKGKHAECRRPASVTINFCKNVMIRRR